MMIIICYTLRSSYIFIAIPFFVGHPATIYKLIEVVAVSHQTK